MKASWFSCVTQRKATATQVESYLTTFHRLSPELLNLVVNFVDEEVLIFYVVLNVHVVLILHVVLNV